MNDQFTFLPHFKMGLRTGMMTKTDSDKIRRFIDAEYPREQGFQIRRRVADTWNSFKDSGEANLDVYLDSIRDQRPISMSTDHLGFKKMATTESVQQFDLGFAMETALDSLGFKVRTTPIGIIVTLDGKVCGVFRVMKNGTIESTDRTGGEMEKTEFNVNEIEGVNLLIDQIAAGNYRQPGASFMMSTDSYGFLIK